MGNHLYFMVVNMDWDDYVEIAFFIAIGLFLGYMLIGDLTGG